MNERDKKVVRAVQSVLTGDLIKPGIEWDGGLDGHCYHASEATWHLLGGKNSGYTPHTVWWDEGGTHWYLVDADGKMLDPTLDDFECMTVPEKNGHPKPFYTQGPGKRAAEVIRRVKQRGLLD